MKEMRGKAVNPTKSRLETLLVAAADHGKHSLHNA
jgi:hypothetical protein